MSDRMNKIFERLDEYPLEEVVAMKIQLENIVQLHDELPVMDWGYTKNDLRSVKRKLTTINIYLNK